MADKFKISGSNTGDYYQINNGKREYFDKNGNPLDQSVFLDRNNAQIDKKGAMRKKENLSQNGLVKHYVKGSKTGRYYTVDDNGNKAYYAADGTSLNEAYFLKAEGVTKNSAGEIVKVNKKKGTAKNQPKQQQEKEVGFLEGLWESTKGAINGAYNIAKSAVTDDEGNFDLKAGAKKVWKATKNVFRDETGKVSLKGAWQALKSAGKGIWDSGAKMVKGMFCNSDGSWDAWSIAKGVGTLAAFGVAIWFAAPVVAAALGVSAATAGVIVGTAAAAPLIIEGANNFFSGANKVMDTAGEEDLVKAGQMAKDAVREQSEGATDVVMGELMRRGMAKGASHHVKSYEANLAKTSAKVSSQGLKTTYKINARSQALIKTYVDGAKSAAQVVRHPVKTGKAIGKGTVDYIDRTVTRKTRKGFSERIKDSSPDEMQGLFEEIAQDEVMKPSSKARALKELAERAEEEGMEDFANTVRDQIQTKKYTQINSEIDNLATRRKLFTRRKAARTEVPEGKVEKIEAKIDEAVEKGQITENQADALRTKLAEQQDGIRSYSRVNEQLSDKKNTVQLDEDFDLNIENIKNPKQRDSLMKKVEGSKLSVEEKMSVLQKILDNCESEADVLDFNFRVRSRKMGLKSKDQRVLQRLAYQKLQTINPKRFSKIDGLAQMVRDDAKDFKSKADNLVDALENKAGKRHWWNRKRDVSDAEKANAKYAQEYAEQHLADVTKAAQAERTAEFRAQMEKGKGLKNLDEKINKACDNKEITEAQRDALLDELPKAKENLQSKKNYDKLAKKAAKTKDIQATFDEIENAHANGDITAEQRVELLDKLSERKNQLLEKSQKAKFNELKKKVKNTDDVDVTRQELSDAYMNDEISDGQYAELKNKLSQREEKINKGRNEEAPEIVDEEILEEELPVADMDVEPTAPQIERAEQLGNMADRGITTSEELWNEYLSDKITHKQYIDLMGKLDKAERTIPGKDPITTDEAIDNFLKETEKTESELRKDTYFDENNELYSRRPESEEVIGAEEIKAPKADEVAPKAEEVVAKAEDEVVAKAEEEVVAKVEDEVVAKVEVEPATSTVIRGADVVDCPESIAIEDMPQSRYDFTSVEKPGEVKPSKFHQENGETLIDEYEFEGKTYTFDETSQRYVSEDGSYLNSYENEYTVTKPSEFGSNENVLRTIDKETGDVTYYDSGLDIVTRDSNGNIVETREWTPFDDGRNITVTRNAKGEITSSLETISTNDSYVNIRKDGSGRVTEYYKSEGNTSVRVTDEYTNTRTYTETKTESITTYRADNYNGFKQGETVRVVSENGKTTVEAVDANGKTTQYPTDDNDAFFRNGKKYYTSEYSETGFNGGYSAFEEPSPIKTYRSDLGRCVDETSLDALANAVKRDHSGVVERNNPWSARNKLLKEIEAKKQKLNTVEVKFEGETPELMAQDFNEVWAQKMNSKRPKVSDYEAIIDKCETAEDFDAVAAKISEHEKNTGVFGATKSELAGLREKLETRRTEKVVYEEEIIMPEVDRSYTVGETTTYPDGETVTMRVADGTVKSSKTFPEFDIQQYFDESNNAILEINGKRYRRLDNESTTHYANDGSFIEFKDDVIDKHNFTNDHSESVIYDATTGEYYQTTYRLGGNDSISKGSNFRINGYKKVNTDGQVVNQIDWLQTSSDGSIYSVKSNQRYIYHEGQRYTYDYKSNQYISDVDPNISIQIDAQGSANINGRNYKLDVESGKILEVKESVKSDAIEQPAEAVSEAPETQKQNAQALEEKIGRAQSAEDIVNIDQELSDKLRSKQIDNTQYDDLVAKRNKKLEELQPEIQKQNAQALEEKIGRAQSAEDIVNIDQELSDKLRSKQIDNTQYDDLVAKRNKKLEELQPEIQKQNAQALEEKIGRAQSAEDIVNIDQELSDKLRSKQIDNTQYDDLVAKRNKKLEELQPETQKQNAQASDATGVKPETVWDTSSPEALDRQLAVRLREMEKQKYDMDAYEALRKEILKLDIEDNVKLDLVDRLDLQEKSHRINPDPQAEVVKPAEPVKTPAEMSGSELDAAYQHTETQLDGEYYYKDWVDANNNRVETRIIRNGKVVEPNAEGIYEINGKKYTLKDGELKDVTEQSSPEFKADDVAPNEGEHIGGEVEDPALVEANFNRNLEAVKHENSIQKLNELKSQFNEDKNYSILQKGELEDAIIARIEDIQNKNVKSISDRIATATREEMNSIISPEIDHMRNTGEITGFQRLELKDQCRKRFEELDKSKVESAEPAETLEFDELFSVRTEDMYVHHIALKEGKLVQFDGEPLSKPVADGETFTFNGKEYKFENRGIKEVKAEEAVSSETPVPTRDDLAAEETINITSDFDKIADETAYKTMENRIKNSTVLNDTEKADLLALLEREKGGFKPAERVSVADDIAKSDVYGAVREQTLGDKAKSLLGATIIKPFKVAGFVAAANEMENLIHDNDGVNAQLPIADDEVSEEVTENDDEKVSSDELIERGDETDEVDNDSSAKEKSEDDYKQEIEGAQTQDELDNIEKAIENSNLSDSVKDQIRALIDARREALKAKAAPEEPTSIAVGDETVTVSKDGDKTVVKDSNGNEIKQNNDGTYTIGGKKYNYRDGKFTPVEDNSSSGSGNSGVTQDKVKKQVQQDDTPVLKGYFAHPIKAKGKGQEITHKQVTDFVNAIKQATTEEELNQILLDVREFKMFKGRKQLRSAIKARKKELASSDDAYKAKKHDKAERKLDVAHERYDYSQYKKTGEAPDGHAVYKQPNLFQRYILGKKEHIKVNDGAKEQKAENNQVMFDDSIQKTFDIDDNFFG